MNLTDGSQISCSIIRPVGYGELKQHCTVRSAWISINRVVYDVTPFVSVHPMANVFRGQMGTECGGLFASSHVLTQVERMLTSEAFRKKHGISVVGRLDTPTDPMHRNHPDSVYERIIYKSIENDVLWRELYTEVTTLLKQKGSSTFYTTLQGTLFLVYYMAIAALLIYWVLMNASVIAAALLALHAICTLAHISHMATHFGFTRNRLLNWIAIHLYDFFGASGLEWQISHQTHHHQPHSSLDQQTNRYQYMGLRLHEHMPWRWWHRYQWWSYWLVIVIYWPYKMLETTMWLFSAYGRFSTWKDIASHFVARVLFFSVWGICYWHFGLWSVSLAIAAYSLSFSYCAFILLYNNHELTHECLGAQEDVSGFHDEYSWAEVQVRTSGNWYPTNLLLRLIQWHYGYFNYHIEHHLFPSLKASMLKEISPIVKRVCEKHGVPYTSTTFWEMQCSFQSHLNRLGESGEVCTK